ncbi:MAG TPA: o-succinylbenzoate synthase [Pyrinomonadaceae bacterium]|nr:o-succinylbenzoate synthase [Pyrinomonadaceae bacterium]
MIITSVELREIRLPLVHFFETSFGRTTERRILLVRVTDKDGAEGWGECTAGEGPFYSEEWAETAWYAIKTFLAPMVVGEEIESAARVSELMSAVRENRMAKAAIETACWDLEAKRMELPLWKHLGGVRTEIASGVSIGIQNTAEELIDKIYQELAAGYQRIKIKIKPGWDLKIVNRVRQKFPDIRLMADANSAYSLSDVALFKEMDRFKLMMIEQPLAHDDIFDHAELQKQINTSVCLDESIHSEADAKHAIALGSCRIINLKLGRVGGHAQAKKVEQVCRENQVAVWCGGMLESGIGRAHNIAMATLAGFTLPGDVSASARYWEEDIIDPPVTVSAGGTIRAPEKPGIGFEVKLAGIEKLTARRETIVDDA